MKAAAVDPEGEAVVLEYRRSRAAEEAVACPTCGRDSCAGCAPAHAFARTGEGRYRLDVPEAGVTLDVDRLRRESGALVGELVVRSTVAGSLTRDGVLSAGDLNLSSVRARQDRGKYLATRARIEDVDFVGLLEELSQRVINAEREGVPLAMLRDLPRPAADDVILIDGLPVLRRHPMILFGDGGAAKSYLALYAAGRMERLGLRTALYDWELAGEDHRDRLERLFGEDMPAVRYRRCSGPLVHEIDRIRRDVQTERLDYLVLDSIAFACDGPPEAAEVAARYFQALRSLGPAGSLHLAHVSKADNGDQKPFGSAFWHNAARSSWYLKRAEDVGEGRVSIAAFNRKSNLGPMRRPVGWDIEFGQERTTFRPADPAATPDLAAALTTRQRIAAAVRAGALSIPDLADRLQVKSDTIEKTVKRGGKVFTYVPGPAGTHLVGLRA